MCKLFKDDGHEVDWKSVATDPKKEHYCQYGFLKSTNSLFIDWFLSTPLKFHHMKKDTSASSTQKLDSKTGLPPWLTKVNMKPNKDFKFATPAKPDPTSPGGSVPGNTTPPKPIDNSKSSDLVHFTRMMGNWSWTTLPADSAGNRKREGFVVFHENGTCSLHYEEKHW